MVFHNHTHLRFGANMDTRPPGTSYIAKVNYRYQNDHVSRDNYFFLSKQKCSNCLNTGICSIGTFAILSVTSHIN